jgi:hypothetical protein
MGVKSGDKGRHYRKQRKRNVKRVEMRAFRKSLEEKKAAAPEAAQ